MSRRRWFALLPLGAGGCVLSLFLLGVLPPDSAQLDSDARPASTTSPTQLSESPSLSASQSATGTTQPAAPKAATATPSRTASPARSDTVRAKVAPPIARVPVSGPGIRAAASYATSRGYQAGVAVIDTTTGKLWGAGNASGMFASESVVKVFIATRLLLSGQMTGDTADTAFRMIARSDDGSADALYGLAGGDQLLPWIATHYGIPDLGFPPTKAGWWSNTHISAIGLVRFYAKVKADPLVWPWLSEAMHQATPYGSDGTYQFFGLKQVDPNAAIKQGWGQDDDDWAAASDFNSTGYVNSDRYAVAILIKGPAWQYRSGTPAMVTSVARTLMPGGVIRP